MNRATINVFALHALLLPPRERREEEAVEVEEDGLSRQGCQLALVVTNLNVNLYISKRD
jgi:hypothetical protein